MDGVNKHTGVTDFLMDESFRLVLTPRNGIDQAVWEEWKARYPALLREMEEARDILLNLTVREKEMLNRPGDIEAMLAGIDAAISHHAPYEAAETGRGKRAFPGKRLWRTSLKIAATLLVLAVVYLGGRYLAGSGGSVNEQVVRNLMIEKYAPEGQKLTVILTDGSVIKLNSETRVRFPEYFQDDRRVIYLEGEAFFNVKRDEARPFTVITGRVNTTVLGTSFNIRAYGTEETIRVAVKEGKVSVGTDSTVKGDDVVLVPNEMASYHKDRDRIVQSKFSGEKVFAWTDGHLIFENAPLHNIIDELERWYGVDIRLSSGVRSDKRYTGKFENESLEHVLEAIEYVHDFSYEIEKDTVRIF